MENKIVLSKFEKISSLSDISKLIEINKLLNKERNVYENNKLQKIYYKSHKISLNNKRYKKLLKYLGINNFNELKNIDLNKLETFKSEILNTNISFKKESSFIEKQREAKETFDKLTFSRFITNKLLNNFISYNKLINSKNIEDKESAKNIKEEILIDDKQKYRIDDHLNALGIDTIEELSELDLSYLQKYQTITNNEISENINKYANSVRRYININCEDLVYIDGKIKTDIKNEIITINEEKINVKTFNVNFLDKYNEKRYVQVTAFPTYFNKIDNQYNINDSIHLYGEYKDIQTKFSKYKSIILKDIDYTNIKGIDDQILIRGKIVNNFEIKKINNLSFSKLTIIDENNKFRYVDILGKNTSKLENIERGDKVYVICEEIENISNNKIYKNLKTYDIEKIEKTIEKSKNIEKKLER